MPGILGHHFLNHGVIFYCIHLNRESQAMYEIVFLNLCIRLFFWKLLREIFFSLNLPMRLLTLGFSQMMLSGTTLFYFYTSGLCILHGHACLILCMICDSDIPTVNIFLLNNNWLVQAISG